MSDDMKNGPDDGFESPEEPKRRGRKPRTQETQEEIFRCGLCHMDATKIGADHKNNLLRCNHCSWSGAVPKNR